MNGFLGMQRMIGYKFFEFLRGEFFYFLPQDKFGVLVAKRIAKNTFWSSMGAIFSRLMTLLSTFFLVRLLTKSVYGELGMIQSTISFFAVFAGFGLGVTSSKYVAEFREKDPKKAGQVIGFSLLVSAVAGFIFSLVLFVAAPWVASHVINAPQLTYPLRIGALGLFFASIDGAQNGALVGFELFKGVAKVNIFTGASYFVFVLVGALMDGVNGVVWAIVINSFFQCLMNYFLVAKHVSFAGIPISLKGWRENYAILLKFTLPAVASGLMVTPINWICGAMLVNQSGGYAEMGVYNIANHWFSVFLFLPNLLGVATLPILSEQISKGNLKQAFDTVVFLIFITSFVLVPIGVFFCFISPFIVKIYGNGFLHEWKTLAITVFTALIIAIQVPIGQFISASGKMWVGFIMNFAWGILFCFLTFLFVGQGAFGVASARLIAYVFHIAWTFAFIVFLIKKHNKNVACSS